MIKFKRGSTENWKKLDKPLEAGQPGYDKEKNKIKIGDGKKLWDKLDYATGLFAEEVLDKNSKAAKRLEKDPEDKTLITYGDTIQGDDKKEPIVGTLYLQHYDTDPEVDYIVEYGTSDIWTYQKWNSGIAKCWGTYKSTSAVQNTFDTVDIFYGDSTKIKVKYPFEFKEIPNETATIQSPGGIVWLANNGLNTKDTSGSYVIISLDKQINTANYNISFQVSGRWKK
jgi:hypothetical protein